MGNERQLVKKSAMDSIASRLQVSREVLERTLKATVIKGTKLQNGAYRPATNEEFVAFISIANTYKLNPLLKEIFAYADPKSGGIIPIVSTDGWNNLMTSHPKYKTHSYVQSEKMVTLKGAKPCPEWMEIHIVKQDDSITKIREYLDECFRDLKFLNPWQTHTKRMLRHKTKIQGAREAFGFAGIYDQDEGERIIEAKLVKEETAGKPIVEQPKALSDENPFNHSKMQKLDPPQENTTEPEKKSKKTSGVPKIVSEEEMTEKKSKKDKEVEEKQEVGNDGYFDLLTKCRELKKNIGEKTYYEVMGSMGFSKSNEMKASDLKQFVKALEEILKSENNA